MTQDEAERLAEIRACLEYSTDQMCKACREDALFVLKTLDAETAERDGVIHDLLIDSEAYRQGHRQAIGEVLEVARSRRDAWYADRRMGMPDRRAYFQAANELIEAFLPMAGLHPDESVPSLPPARLQQANGRLRAAMAEIIEALSDSEHERSFGSEGVKDRVRRIVSKALSQG